MTSEHFLGDDNLWNQINDNHESNGGVYKLIAKENNAIRPINRFLDTDNEGVLYIGKATSFLDRVINFKKSISPKYYGSSHICGRRYKENPNIAKKFPFEQLHIFLIQSDNPKKLEEEELKIYRDKYGEVPPLNAIN